MLGATNPIAIKLALSEGWNPFQLGIFRMGFIGAFFWVWTLVLKENSLGPKSQSAKISPFRLCLQRAGSGLLLWGSMDHSGQPCSNYLYSFPGHKSTFDSPHPRTRTSQEKSHRWHLHPVFWGSVSFFFHLLPIRSPPLPHLNLLGRQLDDFKRYIS